MNRMDDDLGLVAACRAGQLDAFGILVERYQDRLYPTLLRLTGCSEDVRDLLQDAFLRAFEKLARFQGESSFYTWVYRIAVNLTLSDRRKRFGDGRVAPPLGGITRDPSDDPARTDPSRPLEQAERDGMVQKALDALQPEHRAVVVMKDLDGLRYEEIAAILDIPIGTVRSRLHRARCELRERLRAFVEDEPISVPSHPIP